MKTLISVSQAEKWLKDCPLKSASESVSLFEAAGRVLAEPLVADRELPPFDRVMMDGYAIRAHDVHSGLPFMVTGEALAGAPRQKMAAGPHSAMAVMTGAPLPEGADTVVPIEDTENQPNGFALKPQTDVHLGDFIHRCGSDHRKGTILVEAGRPLRSVEMGIAASSGYVSVKVRTLPRVAVFGSGDELVPVDSIPLAHQIRRSNAFAACAVLDKMPLMLSPPGHLTDAVARETERLREAIETHDVVVLSGAVSMGRLDWLPEGLNRLAENLFHGVAQRPGKPMGLWKASNGCVLFALPGNPVSTLVGLHRYVHPWLCAEIGLKPTSTKVELGVPINRRSGLTEFVPVRRAESGGFLPVKIQNSGDYATLALTDGFIELGETQNHWTAGESVPFYPWQ